MILLFLYETGNIYDNRTAKKVTGFHEAVKFYALGWGWEFYFLSPKANIPFSAWASSQREEK